MTTDERFVSACRKAAELRPNKIRLVRSTVMMSDEDGDWFRAGNIECPTQDFIDAMANALGWEYEVRAMGEGWGFCAWTKGHRIANSQPTFIYPDKLTAAKEAFAAIIEA